MNKKVVIAVLTIPAIVVIIAAIKRLALKKLIADTIKDGHASEYTFDELRELGGED